MHVGQNTPDLYLSRYLFKFWWIIYLQYCPAYSIISCLLNHAAFLYWTMGNKMSLFSHNRDKVWPVYVARFVTNNYPIYWIIQNITEYYSILQNITKLYRILLNSTEYFLTLLNITQYYSILFNITEYYRILLNITEYYRILQNNTEYYRILQNNTE